MPSLPGSAGRSLIFALAATPTALFSINFCSWIFGCGCKSWRLALAHAALPVVGSAVAVIYRLISHYWS